MSPDGTPLRCGEGSVVQNADNVVEDQLVCRPTPIEGLFKVRFEVWDQDGTSTLDSQQLTLSASPESSWTTPYWIDAGSGVSGYFITSGGRSWAKFTITAEPAVPRLAFDASSTKTFDPSVGERARIAGFVTYASRLRAMIDLPGGPFVLGLGVFDGPFSWSWDGRDDSGQVMPPGDYTVTVIDDSAPAGTTVTTSTTTVKIEPAATPRLRIDALRPGRPGGWDFSAGPLTVNATASHGGRPLFTVSPGACADQLPPFRSILLTQATPGVFSFDWDGLDDYGFGVGSGMVCLGLTGNAFQGPYAAAWLDLQMLPRPSGLNVMASLAPVSPALDPAVAPTIRALVVDNAHAERYAYSMSLTVAAAPPIGGSVQFSPVTVTQTCSRGSSCTWPVPASLAKSQAIAWRVTVAEAPLPGGASPLTATTGFRITDLASGGPAYRVDVPAVVSPPVIGPSFIAQAATSTTIDIALYPGTGLAAGQPTGGFAFLTAIERAVNDIRGFNSNPLRRWRSSAYDNWGNVAVWAVPEGVTVGYNGDGTCSWGGPRPVSFAESVGILHGVYCRDNTVGRVFSSRFNYAGAAWHELHHSAFDEADEYCCDGGYEDGVNVYSDISSCDDKGSNPQGCHPVEKRDSTGMVTETSAWWRSDPGMIDVMISNDFENADDRRAARNTFDRCRRGGC
jgi:hypothetical protein